MVRRIVCTLALSALLIGVVTAETYSEKVTAVDLKAGTITILLDKKDKTFEVGPTVTVLAQQRSGKGGVKITAVPAKGGMKSVKVGGDVVLTTEKKDGVEVVSKVVILTDKPATAKKIVSPKK